MFYNKQKGETLIEVITALTALVMAGVAAVTVIISVMQANAISKDYLIAQNLAREGIEGVIKIRDSNWLKNPSNKSTCWLALDPDNCTKTISPAQSYIMEMNLTSGKFLLTDNDDGLDLNNGGEASPTNNFFKMKFDASDKLYKQGSSVIEIDPPPTPSFYRMLKFTQIDADKYKVTATIQWLSKSQVNTYVLTSIITNYAK